MNYHVVSLIDVNELLPFVKRIQDTEEANLREDEKLRDELHKFFTILKKHYHKPLHHIGEEKRFGKHLERYLIDKGGFIEIMVEAPLHLSAHFAKKGNAEDFCKALKETLQETVPASPCRQMFIDSVRVSRPRKVITYHKYDRIHHQIVHKPLIAFFAVINVLIIFGILKVALTSLGHLLQLQLPHLGPIDGYELMAAALVSFLVTIIFDWTSKTMQRMLP
ncbi:MAG: hypothetical protein HC945_03245 [Nitrosarchaeum sp.]|nr:hypothetical protein [Nitrosarchaeum sp.]